MSDLKPFNIYTLCSQEKICFFNVGFEALLYIYSQEKSYIFSMWDLKPFSIYTLCSQEKNIFSIWNLKPFRIYILCSQEKKLCFFNVR